MNRYIDVDKLSEMIEARAETLVKGKEAFYYIANWLNKLPAADVEEVKHGEWENMNEIDSAYVNTYRCSACGTTFWIDERPEDANYNYCPNCGAKMGKGQEC